MAREWPETPDDPVDPALAPLLDREVENFDLAEPDLLDAEPVLTDVSGFDDLLNDTFEFDDYAEVDEEPDW